MAATRCAAHPVIENALDVVIARDHIEVDARISSEEILVVEGGGRLTASQWTTFIQQHACYIQNHLTLTTDGATLVPEAAGLIDPPAAMPSLSTGPALLHYRLSYSLRSPPALVHIEQNFLREFQNWSASFILRVRQVDQETADTAMLTGGKTAEYGCEWKAVDGAKAQPPEVHPTNRRAGLASEDDNQWSKTALVRLGVPGAIMLGIVAMGLLCWSRAMRQRATR